MCLFPWVQNWVENHVILTVSFRCWGQQPSAIVLMVKNKFHAGLKEVGGEWQDVAFSGVK